MKPLLPCRDTASPPSVCCAVTASECTLSPKVTKLDRDPASGTALQEISFWLNLERALYRIQEKRESPEVLLTLDILKHGKRFHATVSFDTDTGEPGS